MISLNPKIKEIQTFYKSFLPVYCIPKTSDLIDFRVTLKWWCNFWSYKLNLHASISYWTCVRFSMWVDIHNLSPKLLILVWFLLIDQSALNHSMMATLIWSLTDSWILMLGKQLSNFVEPLVLLSEKICWNGSIRKNFSQKSKWNWSKYFLMRKDYNCQK